MRNPLTLEAFAEWAEKQPAEKEYNYIEPRECAFAQYLHAVGFAGAAVGGHEWSPTGSFADDRPIPAGIWIAIRPKPWTFGALAARLRKAQ